MTTPEISATDAVGPAYERMRKLLFQPFTPQRWIVLGLFSFLEALGGGGGYHSGLNFGGNPLSGKHQSGELIPGDKVQDFLQWVQTYSALIMIVGALAMLLILAFVVLFHWLGARGSFGHLDGVVTGRTDIGRVWREYAREANSLFRWRLTLGLGFLLLFAAVTIPMLFSLWGILSAGGPLTAAKLLFGSGFFLWIAAVALLALPAMLLGFFLNEFVVPLQYLRRSRCGPAAREAWGLVRDNPGAFLIYLLLRVVLAIAAFMLIFMAGLLTCCIGFFIMAVPILGQAIMQPILVFFRALPLQFLGQFGPQFDFFAPPPMQQS